MAHPSLVATLNGGGLAVMPTDTIYGVVAVAGNRRAVSRLYRLRRKNPKKPFIILISSFKELRNFGVILHPSHAAFLRKWWPGKVSVIFKVPQATFAYLHRGTKTLAFRFPRSRALLRLLKETGPLVAPSANPEGRKPAETIREAKLYFGNTVDRYVGGKKKIMAGKPSTLISLVGAKPKIVREGAVLVLV